MADDTLEVTVTGPDGRSLKLPVRCRSESESIEMDMLIYGCVFVREDPSPESMLMGVGIPELLALLTEGAPREGPADVAASAIRAARAGEKEP